MSMIEDELFGVADELPSPTRTCEKPALASKRPVNNKIIFNLIIIYEYSFVLIFEVVSQFVLRKSILMEKQTHDQQTHDSIQKLQLLTG
jgi:hypothetical protein